MALNALYQSGHPEDFNQILAALSPSQDIRCVVNPGSCRGKTVGIIGGGLAGMASAFELRKAGFDITVFEANPERVGGRVYTRYFDKDRELYGELGPMRIPVLHETLWHYIDLFGLQTRPFIQSNPNAFIYLNGKRVRNDSEGLNVRNEIYPTYCLASWEFNYPWQQLGRYGFEMPVLEAPPEIRREILEVLPDYSPQTLYWDALDIRRALESQKLSQGAINMLSNLFPIGGRFLYNNYVDYIQEYYPANFIYMYEIAGGMAKLPEAFYNSFTSTSPGNYYKGIPSGLLGTIDWKSGYSVTGIYQEQFGSPVTLSYTQTSKEFLMNEKVGTPVVNRRFGDLTSGRTRSFGKGEFTEKFDYVICAIPFSVLRVLDIRPQFSPLKMQAIREVTYSPAQKTLFRCNKRFWEEQGIIGGGSYTDLPVNTIWYPSSSPTIHNHGSTAVSKVNPAGEGVITASYSFNLDAVRLGNLPENARMEKIKRDVEEVHGFIPGKLNAIVRESVTQFWDRDPLFRGTFCYFSPQQKRLFSWNMTQPEYGNRIFFAGEHISAVHRWMQGALQSGMGAANGVAAASRFI